jgi:hypothetical protein
MFDKEEGLPSPAREPYPRSTIAFSSQDPNAGLIQVNSNRPLARENDEMVMVSAERLVLNMFARSIA